MSRGGSNDDTTQKLVIRNIFKANNIFTNDSWEKSLLSLTIRNITSLGNGSLRQNQDWVWDCNRDCGICSSSQQMSKCDTRPVFLVGPGAGPEPTRARDFSTMPTAQSALPLLEAQAPGNTSPKGGNSLRQWSPEAVGNLQLPKHTRPDPSRRQHGQPKWDLATEEAQCYYSRRSCCVWDCGIFARPT